MKPFPVLVTLIRGDHDDSACVAATPNGLQQMNGPHDIGRESFHRDVVGQTNQRLSGKVEDEARLHRGNEGREPFEIGKISPMIRRQSVLQAEVTIKRLMRLWIQRVAGEPRPAA